MHKIVHAHIGWRALAAIIDAIIAIFIGLGIFAIAQSSFLASSYAASLQKELLDYQVGSGLYYKKDDGNPGAYDDYSSYTSYQDIVVNYYTVYLANLYPDEVKDKHVYTIYWYNVHVLGLEDSKSLFTGDKIIEPALSSSSLWMYDNSSGTINYDVLGIPSAKTHVDNDLSKPLSDDGKAALLKFYYSSSSDSAYLNAGKDLYYRDFFQKAYSDYDLIRRGYPLIIAVPITLVIFYLVIPLCFHNGETLGKKMLHLSLINKLGFRVTRPQVVLRQLPSILLAVLLFVFLSASYAIMILAVVMFISYLFVIFDKEHRALHDFVAGTLVINAKDSLVYDNAAAQEAGEKAYQDVVKEADRLTSEGEAKLKKEAEKNITYPKEKKD